VVYLLVEVKIIVLILEILLDNVHRDLKLRVKNCGRLNQMDR